MSVLIDALGSRPPALALLERLSGEQLAISIVSHCEVLEGVFGRPNSAEWVAEVRVFFAQFVTIPITDSIVETFARSRSRLRLEGRLIPDFDLVIAATALAHDLTLATRNRRHFDRIEGLKLLSPT